jgi:M6 family metalloprotease-like protein
MNGYESTFKQPDGTEITLRFYGDEFYARTETVDGYTVVFDPATQSYDYASVASDGKKLLKTGMQVGKGNPQALGVKKHLDIDPAERNAIALSRFKRWDDATGNSKRWAEIKAGMQAADAKLSSTQLAPGVSSAPADEGIAFAPPSFTTTGNKMGLTLLIDFTDAPATIPQTNIIDFCNGDSYTGYGNNGSVKKYFQDNSNGMLIYSNVVTVYIRMVQPKSYYNITTNDCGDQANILIKDALDIMKALPNYATEIMPTFNDLTVDGSNRAVAFNVFYAGSRPATWSKGLWPHSWSLYNVGEQALGNGKSVYKYQLTDIGSSLNIGTFCHENGHMLCGFPDIYDYGYDSTGGAGAFCLMNSGGGNTLICAYLRRAAGWCTTTDFNNSTNFTASLTATVGHADFNKIYRYPNPAAPTTEYFLFENRQKTGRDSSIPASGIAIWHIDQLGNKDNQSRVRNTSHANYECTLIQADNLWHFNNDVNSGDSKDLYYLGNSASGYTNAFNDTTGPDANWWSGASSRLWAYNFSASGASMTFQLGVPTNTLVVLSPHGGELLYRGATNDIQWTSTVSGNVKIELYKGGSLDTTLSANEVNDGSYLWAIPVGQTVAADYKIKISSVDNPSYTDLSDANFSIAIPPTLEDVLDTTGITWSSSGNLPWFAQSATSHDGVDAAQSGAISDSQSSSLETTLAGPGTLTFWWKVSSELNYDYLRFYSNGVEQAASLAKISGDVAWVQKTVSLPAGNTTVKWEYKKDSSVASGSDAAWVDQVVWTPSTAPEIAVEQPAGTNLVDGSSTINFGSVNMGSSSAPFTFIVNNLGTANLTGLALAKSGTHSNDFTLGSLGSTTVAPGTSTTFTVTFSPGSTGTRSAALQIASNDGNENPFDITLTGTGVGAGPLDVSPGTPLSASGTCGGPFSPGSQAYVLSNSGGASLNWTATKSTAWLNLSSASGALAAGASTTVTVSIATSANSLAKGVYNDTVAFTNTTNGTGNTTRNVTLTVNGLPASVTLGNLSQVYNGSSRAVTTATSPTGLVVNVTYAGSPAAPTNAGSYAVVATIADAIYQGVTNGTLVVSRAMPTVTNWPTASSIDVGQALSNATLAGGSASVPGTFSFVWPTNTPPVGVYTAAVTFVASDSINYTNVSGSVVITVIDIYKVPFYETFESRQRTDLDGQYGWVTFGTVVQTNKAWGGSTNAAQITGESGYLKHAFNDGRTKVWTDMRVQVVQSPEKPKPDTNSTVAVYVWTNSVVWVFDGTNAFSTGIAVVQGSNVWTRFTTLSDYTTKKFVLFVNDQRVGKYSFYNTNVVNFSELKVGGQSTFVDSIGVTPNQPAMKYMPSLILLR